jgi:hypothetical protein
MQNLKNKTKTYLDNVKDGIKRQIKWAGIETQEDRDDFLDNIIAYCEKMKSRPFRLPKSSKTRHG